MLSKVNSVIRYSLLTWLRACLSLSRKTFGFLQVADRRARRLCFDRLSLAGYTPAGEGQSCPHRSDPASPFAVISIQPAKGVLSKSAGSEGSSHIAVDVIGHHPPHKACKFSGNCCNGNIPFLSMPGQPGVFAPESGVSLVGVSNNIRWVSRLSCY